MAANNIALLPLQQESPVKSYLSSYAQAQQLEQQRMAGERAQAQEQRQQADYTDQQKMQAIDRLGAALDGIPDGDAAGFERVKAFAVQNGLIDPNEAAKYNVSQLPQIRALSAQARALAKERSGAGAGPFQGTGMEAQLANILMAGTRDPRVRATPEYAYAYAQRTQPQMVSTPNGPMLYTPPQMPGILPPIGQGGAQPSQSQPRPAAPPQGGPPARASVPAPGAPRDNAATFYDPDNHPDLYGGQPQAPQAAGVPGGMSPIPGYTPPPKEAKPLTEAQSKDLGFLKRGEAVIDKFTPEMEQALTNDRDAIVRAIPGIGYAAQSKGSRQAVQIAKNFVAVVLRKDTGAAVTPQEFDFYGEIFIPQWRDDAGTLQLKAEARKTFLDALRSGLGAAAALDRMGIHPPEDLAPIRDASSGEAPIQGGGFSAAPARQQSGGGGWSATRVN